MLYIYIYDIHIYIKPYTILLYPAICPATSCARFDYVRLEESVGDVTRIREALDDDSIQIRCLDMPMIYIFI